MPRAYRTRLPPWCSTHLRGLRSARVRCSTEMLPVPLLGIRPAFAAWALRADHACDRMASAHDLGSRGSRRLLTGGSSAGPSASPPRELCQPLSRLACRLGVFGRRPVVLPPLAAWAWRTLQRSKPPGLSPDFPTRCSPPAACLVSCDAWLPPRCFSHPRGFEFSRRPLRDEKQAPRRP
jgi:hypothetical protein